MTHHRPNIETPADSKRPPAESDAILALDLEAVRLNAALLRITVPLARAARAFHERRAWREFCVASAHDFAVDRFGRCGRWLRDLALLGRGLERLPGLELALTGDDGGRPIRRVAATVVSGIASVDSEDAWIELARRVSVRELKQRAAQARAIGQTSPLPPASPESASIASDASSEVSRGSGNVVREAAGPVTSGPDSESPERRLLRFVVPATVQAAFEDSLLLFRAVAGFDASAESFIEALVAEAQAGPSPPDVDNVGILRSRPDGDSIERQLERATHLWRRLGEPVGARWRDSFSAKQLRRLEACSRVAGNGDAAELNRQIGVLLRLEGEIERRLAEVLARMVDRGVYPRLMFRGLGHYAEERLGLARTAAQDRARVVRRLRGFPRLRAAYDDGRLRLSAAAVVLRILGRGPVERRLEEAWIAHARQHSVKRLLDEERALKRRRLFPPSAGSPGHSEARRVAEAGLRAAAGASPEFYFRMRLPADLAAKFVGAVEHRRSMLTRDVEGVPWDQPWPDSLAAPSIQAARLFSIRCRRVPAWVGLLGLLEDFVATWDPPQGGYRRRADAVYARDGWRCSAPGCTSRRGLEDHHLRYRSRGGVNALWNRICLCFFHHRQGEHGGLASFAGSAPLGIRVQLGRGALARRFINERRLEARPDAHSSPRSRRLV